MNRSDGPGIKPGRWLQAGLAGLAIMLIQSSAVGAEDRMVTQETLLDRVQIEDLLVRYYADMTAGSGHDLAEYFTEDAVLDVNGTVAKGHEEIAALYGAGDEDTDGEGAAPGEGRFHMLLTNPIIKVDGDTATAWVIWTGITNENIRLAPRLREQGREYTELVQRDGRWLIKKRYITADSGMPERWDENYEPRTHR